MNDESCRARTGKAHGYKRGERGMDTMTLRGRQSGPGRGTNLPVFSAISTVRCLEAGCGNDSRAYTGK